jgi:tetratricopeptide (TPR) repeat protein
LELSQIEDNHERAKYTGQLGSVAYERFLAGREAGAAEADLLKYLNDALRRYHEALGMLSANAIPEIAVTHNQLGLIYESVGKITQARTHYDASIRYKEQMGDIYSAAQTRYNVALMYARRGDFNTSLLYAEAALRGFESSPNAANMAQLAQRLIDAIKQDMQKGGSS